MKSIWAELYYRELSHIHLLCFKSFQLWVIFVAVPYTAMVVLVWFSYKSALTGINKAGIQRIWTLIQRIVKTMHLHSFRCLITKHVFITEFCQTIPDYSKILFHVNLIKFYFIFASFKNVLFTKNSYLFMILCTFTIFENPWLIKAGVFVMLI